MIIELLMPACFWQAQEFYKNVNYQSLIQSTDTVIIARENDKIVGTVRLAHEHDTLILRGMHIAPTHQKHGIGSLLLEKINNLTKNQICWCLPHSWLEQFYGKIGFKKIDKKDAPIFLQKRLEKYYVDHPDLIVMVKS